MRKFMVVIACALLAACSGDNTSPSNSSETTSTTMSSSAAKVEGYFIGFVVEKGAVDGVQRDPSGNPTCGSSHQSVHLSMNTDARLEDGIFLRPHTTTSGELAIDYQGGAVKNISSVIVDGHALRKNSESGNPDYTHGALILPKQLLEENKSPKITLCVA